MIRVAGLDLCFDRGRRRCRHHRVGPRELLEPVHHLVEQRPVVRRARRPHEHLVKRAASLDRAVQVNEPCTLVIPLDFELQRDTLLTVRSVGR